jgi:hypothetical protein
MLLGTEPGLAVLVGQLRFRHQIGFGCTSFSDVFVKDARTYLPASRTERNNCNLCRRDKGLAPMHVAPKHSAVVAKLN